MGQVTHPIIPTTISTHAITLVETIIIAVVEIRIIVVALTQALETMVAKVARIQTLALPTVVAPSSVNFVATQAMSLRIAEN